MKISAASSKLVVLLGILWSAGSLPAEDFQGSTHKIEFDAAPFNYSSAVPEDPVAQIQKDLRKDRTKGWLNYDPQFGYLPVVLDLLKVPAASQMLVFSKTSLPRQQIGPDNPRALYFSDNVYIGYVPGAPVMEIAAIDPKLGAVFYTVNQDKDEPLRFRRDQDCLSCHGSARSMGVPGFVLRSVGTTESGEPIAGTDHDGVNHFAPIAQRWGGWFVTGAPSDWIHLGNRPSGMDTPSESLSQRGINPDHYLGRGSEPLPLLVHDHQTHMHNYFTRLSYEGRQHLSMYGHIRYLKHQIRALVRYLLFVEEASLPSPVPPATEFIRAFQKSAHRDKKGRSLRDFELNTRLFKHPCSYLIESEEFENLPVEVKSETLRVLWEILTGKNQDPEFSSLTTEDRTSVLEILNDTLQSLPEYWKGPPPN